MKFLTNQVATLSNFSCINEELTVPLTVTAQKVYFGNYQRLQNVLLQRFEIIVNDNMTTNPEGQTLVTETNLDKLFLYLLDKDGNVKVDTVPLSKFKVNTTASATNTQAVFPGFDNVDIDWQKSYITGPAVTMTSINGQVIQVQVQYMWKPGTAEFQTRYTRDCDREKAYRDIAMRIRQQAGLSS